MSGVGDNIEQKRFNDTEDVANEKRDISECDVQPRRCGANKIEFTIERPQLTAIMRAIVTDKINPTQISTAPRISIKGMMTAGASAGPSILALLHDPVRCLCTVQNW